MILSFSADVILRMSVRLNVAFQEDLRNTSSALYRSYKTDLETAVSFGPKTLLGLIWVHFIHHGVCALLACNLWMWISNWFIPFCAGISVLGRVWKQLELRIELSWVDWFGQVSWLHSLKSLLRHINLENQFFFLYVFAYHINKNTHIFEHRRFNPLCTVGW